MKRKMSSLIALFGLMSIMMSGCSGGGSAPEQDNNNSSIVLANAGSDHSVEITEEAIELDGSASTGVTSAEWTFYSKPDGSAATISNSTSVTASFVADVIGLYSVQLSINGGASVDIVNITVEAPSSASARAGDDQDVLIGDTVTLDGSGSIDANTTLWEMTAKPSGSTASFASATSVSTTFTPDVAGEYTIELTVNGGISTDTVTVSATSVLAKISVPEGSDIVTRSRFGETEYAVNLADVGAILSATSSRVVSGGSIASYEWEQTAGPSVVSGASDAETYTFTAPSMADMQTRSERYKWQVFPISRKDMELRFQLTVRDTSGNEDSELITVYLEDEGQVLHPSSGLKNVPLNSVVYLSGPSIIVDVDGNEVPVTDWQWTLSSGTFLDTGTSVSTSQFPAFIPDSSTTTYTVSYQSTSGGVSGSLAIKAATFVGVGVVGGTTAVPPQCGACHLNGVGRFDMVEPWQGTKHASIFENSMETYALLAPEPYLWEFNTVGYNIDASNNGFDDRAESEAFIFPDEGMAYDDFTAAYPSTMVLSNVQCENCHGPGSKHAGNKDRIAFSASQTGICGQCHVQEAEWKNSVHHSTGVVEGNGSYQATLLSDTNCVRCHTGKGFADYIDYGMSGVTAITEAEAFPGVTCAGCHDPHDATNYRQLRVEGEVAMAVDGSTVTANRAAVCYTCHNGFFQYGLTLCDTDLDGAYDDECTDIEDVATRYYDDRLHFNSQASVFEGKGAITDLSGDGVADFSLINNSFHATSNFILYNFTGDSNSPTENIKCVTCHMAAGPAEGDSGYRNLGGHSFAMRSGEAEFTKACLPCHGEMPSVNRPAHGDYDGDGSVDANQESTEGIQDEVQGLLFALSEKLKTLSPTTLNPDSGTLDNGSGGFTPATLSYESDDAYQDTTDRIKRAVWNYNLIASDRSYGVHNAAYIIRILQQTYTAVGGNAFLTDYPNAEIRD